MLEQKLIESSVHHSSEKFSAKTQTVCPFLYTLENFLHPNLLTKLLDFVSDDQLNWHTVKKQEYKNRRQINFIADTVIEETHIVFDNLTDQVIEACGRKQTFMGISIWKDLHPYKISRHTDISLIGSSIQIYLNACQVDMSTHFLWQDSIIKPKNLANYGYFMDNKGRVAHWLENAVPEGHVRYSLHAIWRDE